MMQQNDNSQDDIIRKYLGKIGQLEKSAGSDDAINQLRAQNRYLQQLLEITGLFHTAENLNCLLQKAVDAAVNLAGAERGFLMLADQQGRLEFKVALNISRETLESENFRISRSVVNQVMAAGKPIFITDVHQDDNFRTKESILDLGLMMIMCAPLSVKNHPLGVIYVDSRAAVEAFTGLERMIFEAFASQAAVAIENMRLYEESIHDQATGLYNEGYLRRRINQEIFRIIRYQGKGSGFSLALLAIDDFQAVNDSYGLPAGKAVLNAVAGLMNGSVRSIDITARYAGDEFAVLMPETGIREAGIFGERLLREIHRQACTAAGKSVSLTASIGIAAFPFQTAIDADGVFLEAEQALATSKSKGGNTVTAFVYGGSDDNSNVIIGKSSALKAIIAFVKKAAAADSNVLITGETGVGKELAGRLILQQSWRRDQPFVTVNCSAIPENLLESELFGYEKGAFTGAYQDHKGKFELADGGTLLLDEIGDLSYPLQAKVLRAIETHEIEKIGRTKCIKVDVRVIAITNRDIEAEVNNGTFRRDLFYRLNVLHIHLPPLRERPEDIDPLAGHFLAALSRKFSKTFRGFAKDAQTAMRTYPWPGNVRELMYRIERAIIMGTKDYISLEDLGLSAGASPGGGLREARGTMEKGSIQKALIRHNGNITKSAGELGISRITLRNLMKKYGLANPKTIKQLHDR